MANKWKIKNSGDVGGGKDSADLVGCFINENNAQNPTAYQFNSPNPNSTVLATTQTTSLPSVPFSFPQFGPWPSGTTYLWTITVNSLTGGASGNDATGTWINTDPAVDNDESGTFTAQSDAKVDDEAADAASASA